MEWYLVLLLILGSLVLLMMAGMPVAFCFLMINLVGVFWLWGGEVGLKQLIVSFQGAVSMYALMTIPLFILMGEVMFHSGIIPNVIDTLNKLLGRLPGRLSLLAVGFGTIFATLTGASMASIAVMGEVLVPEMEKYGYKKPMTLGPIIGSGGLAIMIPPSGLAVFLGVIAEVSIGKLLIAIIIPGLLMAILYATYIILRCRFQPSIAPSYEVPPIPILEKLVAIARYILPLGFVIFMIIGVMLLGVATATEAAASGAISVIILAAAYKRLNWAMMKKAIRGTLHITGMMFLIVATAVTFSQVLAFSGAGTGLIEFTLGLPLSPILIIIAMQVIVLFLGGFMSVGALIMVCIPLFMPIVHTLGFNPVWFAVLFLLNVEIATTSPPYGLNLFVMKGVAPPDTTMGDIYRAALPFIGCDLIAMALIITFPMVALWLPALMR